MKSAPFECPRCSAEKEWRCTNDPADDPVDRISARRPFPGFALLELGVFRLLWQGRKLKYHCDRCGYSSTYSPD